MFSPTSNWRNIPHALGDRLVTSSIEEPASLINLVRARRPNNLCSGDPAAAVSIHRRSFQLLKHACAPSKLRSWWFPLSVMVTFLRNRVAWSVIRDGLSVSCTPNRPSESQVVLTSGSVVLAVCRAPMSSSNRIRDGQGCGRRGKPWTVNWGQRLAPSVRPHVIGCALLILAPIRYTTISSPRAEMSAVKRPRQISAIGLYLLQVRATWSVAGALSRIVSARVVWRRDRVFPAIPRSRRRDGLRSRAVVGLVPSGECVDPSREWAASVRSCSEYATADRGPDIPRVWDGFRPGPGLTLAVITSRADTDATGFNRSHVPNRTRHQPRKKGGRIMRDHRLRCAVGLILAVCV